MFEDKVHYIVTTPAATNEWTYRTKTRADVLILKANNFRIDPKKKERKKLRLCKYCFYVANDGLAGQAFTMKKCDGCQIEMSFPTTNTDRVCIPCSDKYKICKHCAADINLRKRKIK